MSEQINTEKAIRCMVKSNVTTFAQTFSERHISEVNNPNGTLNMKIHNVFISALGEEFQYYTALSRSFDSSLGNMLENLAVSIARLFYDVSDKVEGCLYPEQTAKIAELLEAYKNKKILISYNYLNDKQLWNLVCNSDKGYEIVIDEYEKNAHLIENAYYICNQQQAVA